MKLSFISMIVFFTTGQGGMGAIMTIVFIIISKGLVIINPNFGAILLLFGQYEGSIKESGLFWINPLYKRISVSLRARNFESDKVKVDDKMGNPIHMIILKMNGPLSR